MLGALVLSSLQEMVKRGKTQEAERDRAAQGSHLTW
jgi:hypothetical protein